MITNNRQVQGFYGTVVLIGSDKKRRVYFSLGNEISHGYGVIGDEYGVDSDDIFFYATWDNLPELFRGRNGFTLLSIDEVVIEDNN